VWRVLRRAEQHADGWPFVGLLHVAVERLDVERELSEIGGLELLDLQFEGDEALQLTVEENEVDREVLVTDLHGVLRADEAEVAAQFSEETPEVSQQPAVEIRLGVIGSEPEKLDVVSVLELCSPPGRRGRGLSR
jgi:hypothetical protein